MLIVLRGNSGSGKTTTANLMRNIAIKKDSTQKIALIEQDYICRIILKEKQAEGTDNIDLIFQTVAFALRHDYDVILEGILFSDRYREMLKKLRRLSSSNYFYYFDVSLPETLKRHALKSYAHELSEEQMTEWYIHQDLLGFEEEKIIDEGLDQQQIVEIILKDTSL